MDHESEEEETHTSVLKRSVRKRRQIKRYTPPNFSSNFSLFIIDDDSRTVMEVVDSEDGKL